jgi:cytochrome c556
MTIWSERLRDAAQANDEKAVADIMKDYGRVTCGACHTTFRQPQTQQ